MMSRARSMFVASQGGRSVAGRPGPGSCRAASGSDRSTAITTSAPRACAVLTGTGLTTPPSTSQWRPSRTGGYMPGIAALASTARQIGPRRTTISRPSVRSAAETAKGIGRSSSRRRPYISSPRSQSRNARLLSMPKTGIVGRTTREAPASNAASIHPAVAPVATAAPTIAPMLTPVTQSNGTPAPRRARSAPRCA